MILNNNQYIHNNKMPPHTQRNNNNNSIDTPTFSFVTHNVNSLYCVIKNTAIDDTFIDFDTDFIGLTETRHKSDQFYRYSHDPNFCAFWSSRINTHAGVGILVKRSWAIYIQRTFLDDDRFIYIDLYLAGNIKLRIFCIYLHASQTSDSKKERLKLHKTIIKHIKDGLKSDFKTILLGDFNANLDNYWSNSHSGSPSHWRFDFYDQIFALNFLDLYDLCHDTPEPTFCVNNRSSRIDTIFASPNLVSDFLLSSIEQSDLYSSDHKIVFAFFANIQRRSQAKSRLLQNKRQVPNLRSMNTTKWSEFAEYTDFHYNCHNLDRCKDL